MGDDAQLKKGIDYSEYVIFDKRMVSEANGNDGGHTARDSLTAARADIDGDWPARDDEKRKEQKRRSKRRTMNCAKEKLETDHVSSLGWHPNLCVRIYRVVSMKLISKWNCKQLIRAD